MRKPLHSPNVQPGQLGDANHIVNSVQVLLAYYDDNSIGGELWPEARAAGHGNRKMREAWNEIRESCAAYDDTWGHV